jgi:carbamoyltransferase
VPVEHHLAHAASAYHCSGFREKTAILGIDGKGEYATTFFGYGENGKIHKIKEFYDPDSLGGLYGALTEYLGFEMLDGEYKVMGMAPYGDPNRYDFSRLAKFENGELTVNTDYANVIGFAATRRMARATIFHRSWSTGSVHDVRETLPTTPTSTTRRACRSSSRICRCR